MVGIALLGAGIFAREQHLPAIQATTCFELKAVYSRSEEAATSLAQQAGVKVDIYFDSPATSGRSLDDLLARTDISAVSTCVTILAQPRLIQKAVIAGKHVLSEKPIAHDMKTATELIKWYNSQPNAPIWAVAENFRFNESLGYAESRVQAIGGQLTTCRLSYYGSVKKNNKYVNTDWRKTPEFQGGFLLDSGIHFVASLRLLLNAIGQEVKQVVAFSSLLEEHLPPVDTVHAIVSTNRSRNGTICISFGVEHKSGLEIEIVTTNGAVVWTPVSVKSTTKLNSDGSIDETKEFVYNNAVRNEFEAFGEAILTGSPDLRQAPLEALRDLALLQALLESAEGNGLVKAVEVEDGTENF
ncbi:hypothetical protein FSARC_10491 [Fusarium sarcochroum]|uniref:Oxidoreductase n=1 Tax=Fusarium sarcochroum TaxID=1208366 RepID=A0A8H4TM46_9HYPO|nr:hypothetical protein FSARC_10491 [Fusarium sarcochroum]